MKIEKKDDKFIFDFSLLKRWVDLANKNKIQRHYTLYKQKMQDATCILHFYFLKSERAAQLGADAGIVDPDDAG